MDSNTSTPRESEPDLLKLELVEDVLSRNFASAPAFAKVMEDNPELCKEFAELCLGIEIKRLGNVVVEQTFPSVLGVSIRVDALLTGSNQIVEIEMQAVKEGPLARRLRYYQARIDAKLLKKGHKYNELPELYILSICKYDEFHAGRAVYRFDTTCMDDRSVVFDSGLHFTAINTKGDTSGLSPELRDLVKYIETNQADTEGGLAMKLKEATDRAYDDEIWVGSIIDINEAMENRIHFAAKQAEERGRAEGRAEGEGRMAALYAKMREAGASPEEIDAALSSPDRQALYEKYGV